MNMKRVTTCVAGLTAATVMLITSAGVGAASTPQSWMLSANGNSLPPDLAATVEAAGGTITSTIPQIGLAFATSSDAGFAGEAGKIAGIGSVTTDLTVNWVEPTQVVAADFGYPPASADDDRLFDLQWDQAAVDSVGAWNAGHRGNGVKVAVLDTGFNLTHPDLAPNIIGSANMTDQGPANGQWTGTPQAFSHGTHVAGIVAAPDNAFGTIGTAPEADLLLVKVLLDNGSSRTEDLLQGIVYAADQDADVINMSIVALYEKNGVPGQYTAKEAAELKNAVGKATTYAYEQGTTVIASAGNNRIDFDHTNNLIHLPSDAPHVSSVAATAPIAWAKGPGVPFWDGSYDHPASYTNFGQSAIDFAAPGGDLDYTGNENCTVAGFTRACSVFDGVLAPGAGGVSIYFWSIGTSMAAPHVAGVAAIIIGANGGDMSPARVEAALRASADDIGKPGNDDFSGAGRVNAANAVD